MLNIDRTNVNDTFLVRFSNFSTHKIVKLESQNCPAYMDYILEVKLEIKNDIVLNKILGEGVNFCQLLSTKLKCFFVKNF